MTELKCRSEKGGGMNNRFMGAVSLTLVLIFASHGLAQKTRQRAPNEAEIKALYDQWAKAFEAKNIDGIMAIYAPGDDVIAYDVVPPLQYKGKDAYRKDYLEFLNQYDGPIHVEYR